MSDPQSTTSTPSTRLAALVLALAPSVASAQVYTQSQFSQPYTPVSGGTPISFPSNDDGAATIPIGFTWTFFGRSYTRLNVAVNGHAFPATPCSAGLCDDFADTCTAGFCEADSGSTGAFSSPVFGGGSNREALLAPFWDDLYVRGANPAAVVVSTLSGVAPNRVLTVEWQNIRGFSTADTLYASFQLRLREGGAVELAWGPVVGATASAWTGTIGLQSPDRTQAFLPANLPCANSGLGSCNMTQLATLTNQVLAVQPVDGPELVAGVRAPPGGEPSQTIQVAVSARNIGTRTTTTGFSASVYFSTDTTIDAATDAFLGTVTFPVVPAGAVRTATLTTQVPGMALPGRYHVGAIVDPARVVPESSRGNNVAVSSVFLIGPELNATVRGPTQTGPGETFTAATIVSSDGSPVMMTRYALFLSTDENLDARDLRVGTGTIAVGGQSQVEVQLRGAVSATITPGTYRVIVQLDPDAAIAEFDETNNVAVSTTPTVVIGPDLRVTDVSGAVVAFRGRPYVARATVRNIGGARASNFFYSFYLSDNNLITATDLEVGTVGPLTLLSTEVASDPLEFVIPTTIAPGTYYLGVIGDSTSQLIEADLRNNIARQTATITVRDPVPDFRVADVVASSPAAAGEPFVVERRIENIGVLAGTVPYAIYLSTDATLSAADVRVGQGSVTVLPGGEVSGADYATVPAELPAGTYTVLFALDPDGVVEELDDTNNVAASSGTVVVEASVLRLVTTVVPPATVGVSYAFELSARGGPAAYVWSVDGALPPGITLDAATGRLEGLPTREGQFPVRFTVRSGSLSASLSTSMFVVEPTVTLAVITRAVPPAFVGKNVEQPLVAVGGAPAYVWSVAGALPPGLTLSPDGVLTGVATAPAVAAVTVRVTDVRGATAERPLTVRVVNNDDALRFADAALPDGIVGEAYDATLMAMNGSAPYRFELSSGRLPPGLALTDAKLTGTPTTAGTYTFGLRVIDARGDVDANRYVVEIAQADGAVRFVTTGLPGATRGEAYVDGANAAVVVKAVSTGAQTSLRYAIILGALPAGLTLAADGTLAGTPTEAGLFTFAVEASDPAGNRDRRALSIAVDEPAAPEPTPEDPSGCGCTATSPTQLAPWLALTLLPGLLHRRRRRGSSRAPRGGTLAAVAALVAVGAAPTRALAQPAPAYQLAETREAFVERTGGTTLSFGSTDDDEAAVTLPFPFKFYEARYTTMNVGTNGFVSFVDSARSLGNTAIPATGTPSALIALFWDDLSIRSVTTHVEGAAPTRRFIVQWQVTRLGESGVFRMQLHLFEGEAGRFELRYASTAATGFFTASVGFENPTGALGSSWRRCSPNCSLADLTALDGLVLSAQMDGGTDVSAATLTAPRRVYAGVPFDARFVLGSVHQNPLGPLFYTIQMNDGGAWTTLVVSEPVTLTPFQQLAITAPVTLPLATAPGPYTLRVVADSTGVLVEPNEADNTATTTVQVAPRQPDLTVQNVVASPTTGLAAGASIQVSWRGRNVGNAAAQTDFDVALSANRVPTTGDVVLGTTTASIGALGTVTSTLTLTIPSNIAPGRYYVAVLADPRNQVLELSKLNNVASAADPVAIATSSLDIQTRTLPVARTDQDYSYFFRAAGGDGTYRWEVSQGTLPAGMLLLPSTGELRGRLTMPARVPLTVRVTSASQTDTQDVELVVVEPTGPMTIVTRAFAPGLVGRAYPALDAGQTLADAPRLEVVNASGEVRFTATSGLPSGFVLDPDGLLRGVPQQAGLYEVGVSATDGTQTATRAVRLQLVEPGRLTIVAAALPDAVVGEEYAFQLQAIGVTPGMMVQYTSPSVLPSGLSLTATGLLTGLPSQVGRASFVVEATSGAGPALGRDSVTLVLDVVARGTFGITPATLPEAERGKPYDVTLEARGGSAPLEWSLQVIGNLPRGLRYEIEDGAADRSKLRILGTPEEVPTGQGGADQGGVISFFVTLADAEGRETTQPYAIRVREPAAPAPPPIDEGCGCRAGAHPRDFAGTSLVGLVLWVGARRRRTRLPKGAPSR